MESNVRSGFLLAADISGYTEFLTGSELEHGHAIVAEVMACLTRQLDTSLRIVKYEGDAVLCYVEDGRVQDPNLLLDLLDEGYLAFSDRLFNIQKGSTCTCRACKNAPSLDLKYILHHGQFVVADQGRGEDLSGPDVILLHRLMKNHVVENTGLSAYVLATRAALELTGHPRLSVAAMCRRYSRSSPSRLIGSMEPRQATFRGCDQGEAVTRPDLFLPAWRLSRFRDSRRSRSLRVVRCGRTC